MPLISRGRAKHRASTIVRVHDRDLPFLRPQIRIKLNDDSDGQVKLKLAGRSDRLPLSRDEIIEVLYESISRIFAFHAASASLLTPDGDIGGRR